MTRLVGLDWRDKDQRSYFDQSGFPTYREDRLDLRSLTPRLKLPLRNHTFVAGVDLHEWRYRSQRTDRPENIGQPTNRVTVNQETAGWYLQDTVELGRGTFVTGVFRPLLAPSRGNEGAAPKLDRVLEVPAGGFLGHRHAGGRLADVFRPVGAL